MSCGLPRFSPKPFISQYISDGKVDVSKGYTHVIMKLVYVKSSENLTVKQYYVQCLNMADKIFTHYILQNILVTQAF